MSIAIVSNKEWHQNFVREVETRTGEKVVYIEDKADVNQEKMSRLSPRLIFFPHWSYIIPAEVYENFTCIIFHMTDVPFGRGGSPLQNLIARGIYETKLSAIKCGKELDAGDVYMKRPLSLWGTAEEIYLRAAELTKEMMIELCREDVTPVSQTGKPVIFRRRKPEEGDISELDSLNSVFDYIRMLDAETYPAAFLNVGRLHLEFSRASLREDHILADVKIFIRPVQEDE